ncbi:MAG: NfeD family protein [bacterium]
MDSFLQGLEYWHWFLLGVVFLILEVFAPGVFFIWLAFGAGVVGVLAWLITDLSWQWQVLLFGGLSILSAIVGRMWLVKNPIQSEQPNLNRRGQQYVGREFTLKEPIVNGIGKIQVDDSTWKIQGSDCAAGTQVKVTGVDGVVLEVECLLSD